MSKSMLSNIIRLIAFIMLIFLGVGFAGLVLHAVLFSNQKKTGHKIDTERCRGVVVYDADSKLICRGDTVYIDCD